MNTQSQADNIKSGGLFPATSGHSMVSIPKGIMCYIPWPISSSTHFICYLIMLYNTNSMQIKWGNKLLILGGFSKDTSDNVTGLLIYILKELFCSWTFVI